MVNNEDDIEILKSNRNRDILILGNYLYNFSKQNAKNSVWRCRNRNCHGKVRLLTSGCRIYAPHNHNSVQDEINILRIQNEYKKEAKNTSYTNKDIFFKTIIKRNDFLPIKKKSIYKTLGNVRRKYNNEVINNGEIPLHLLFTYNKEEFVRFSSCHDEIQHIYSSLFIEYLSKSNVLLADGTFLSAPDGYSQVYIIYAYYNTICLPVCYFLMKYKSEESYSRNIFALKEKFKLDDPKHIITDNEMGPKNAFKFAFPSSKQFLCLTHFSKNVYAMVIKFGLSNRYTVESRFKNFIGMCKSLVFVPSKNMNACIKKLIVECVSYKDSNVSNFFTLFLKKYFTHANAFYVLKPGLDAVYRLNLNIDLTTNTAEGYNSELNYSLNFKKPSLIVFLKKIAERHAFMENKIRELLKDVIITNSSLKTLEKYEKLKKVINDFDKYVHLDFLRTISDIYGWCY
jgi:uncharacterized protein YihD (DUF1040 family)